MIEFNEEVYKKMIASADEFFEAAVRCGFTDSIKLNKYPLMIPNFTNRAFACKLYLKATFYLNQIEPPRCHQLNELFSKLNEKVRKDIYDLWRTIDGQNVLDCDYSRQMFKDNLEANGNVFEKFRYAHEWWKGSSLSLESNLFTENKRHLNHFFTSRPFGSPEIYDGFLDQLFKSIKKYHNQKR